MPVPAVFALDGMVRDYAWGSTSAIQQLLGREPDGRPAAELWFGAHADDPASVPSLGTTLDQLIEADPEGLLGPRVVAQFGPQLPFLLKVLAADKALSIQVHPTIEQAEAGFAAEDAAGVPRDAPTRNYRDRNHKPELLCALTVFTALCGFRPPAETVRLIDELPAVVGEALSDVRADLDATNESVALRAAFTRLLTLPTDDRAALVDRVVSGCRGILTRYPPLAAWADGPVGAARVVDLCARDFPGDVGAVLSLLLNPVVLQPGEAIYLGAGNLHAYLRGMGVEIMASSDNVLRCGLTAKHVDVAELLTITDFTPLPEPRWPDSRRAGFGVDFEVPVPDFHLHSADLDAYRKPGCDAGSCAAGTAGQPYLVLCASGAVSVEAEGTVVTLTPGHAAFVPAREVAFTLRGTGQTFLATVG
ncbi:MAG: mannose-6-phosphate isomerase, class I [Jatrophihabitantaceae bacterium]